MAQVLGGDEARKPNVDPPGRAILILLLGFVGGTLGAACHVAILSWLPPMLGLHLPQSESLAMFFPVTGWATSIFAIDRAMKWLRRAEKLE